MTRKLTKADLLEYVPAVAATPYQPGREIVLRTWPPGSQQAGSGEIARFIGGWDDGSIRGRFEPDGTIVAYQKIPAIAAKPAVPAYTIDNGVAEWNAGGNSISPLSGDGAWRFKTSKNPGGIVVGLVTANLSTLPAEASHAIYVSGGTAFVMESGVIKHQFPLVVSDTTVYIIRRVGTQVSYSADAAMFNSAKPTTTAKIYLDAALFLSGDYVDSPELLEGGSGPTVGEIDAALPRLAGYVSDIPPNYIMGSLPTLGGNVYEAHFGGYIAVFAALPPLGGVVTGLEGRNADIDAALPALRGVVANYNYSFVDGALPALRGFASWYDETKLNDSHSSLSMGDWFIGSARVSDRAISTIRYSGRLSDATLQSVVVYDSLLYMDEVQSHQALFAEINSALSLGSGIGSSAAGDLSAFMVAARAPRQYAVNVLSGALTTYDGFDFTGFARTAQHTYASRKDGVYRLREGDDNGSSRIVAVDFGVIPLGANSARIIETIYLGLITDGQVFVRMTSGEQSYAYPAISCLEMLRAVPGKGAKDRLWNISIEVEDSTYLNLDLVELYVTETRRRWGRG